MTAPPFCPVTLVVLGRLGPHWRCDCRTPHDVHRGFIPQRDSSYYLRASRFGFIGRESRWLSQETGFDKRRSEETRGISRWPGDRVVDMFVDGGEIGLLGREVWPEKGLEFGRRDKQPTVGDEVKE